MLRTLTLLTLVLATAAHAQSADPLPRAKPEDVGISSGRLARIGQVLDQDVADGRSRVRSWAIARDGKLVSWKRTATATRRPA